MNLLIVECLVCGAKAEALKREFADALQSAHKLANPEHIVTVEPVLKFEPNQEAAS